MRLICIILYALTARYVHDDELKILFDKFTRRHAIKQPIDLGPALI
jgi:hypothetical protein